MDNTTSYKKFKNIIKYGIINKDVSDNIDNNIILPNIDLFNKVILVQNLKGIITLRKQYGNDIILLNDKELLDRAFKEKKNKIIKWFLLRSKKEPAIEKEIIKYIIDVNIYIDNEIILDIVNNYQNIYLNKDVFIFIKYNSNQFL